MIRTKLFAAFVATAAVVFPFTSCGSTPAAEPAPVVEEPVQEEQPVIVTEGDFASANSRASNARSINLYIVFF